MSRHPWTVTTAPQGAPSPTLRTPAIDYTNMLQNIENNGLSKLILDRGIIYLPGPDSSVRNGWEESMCQEYLDLQLSVNTEC